MRCVGVRKTSDPSNLVELWWTMKVKWLWELLRNKRGGWARIYICSSARALIERPLGADTKSWQVIRRILDLRPVAVLDDTGDTRVCGLEVSVEVTVESTWRREWWGFWHSLDLCNDLHCLEKCPGLRQLMHNLFSFTVAIMRSWESDLNFVHEKRGWISVCTRDKVYQSKERHWQQS